MKNRRPRIGLNGRFLVAKRTGVQRAAYHLFRSVTELGKEFDFFLFTSPEEGRAPEWKLPNVEVIPCNISPKRIFRNHLWEQFALPQLAKKYQIDILHSPANLAPVLYRGKSIVHIHDVCFLVEPSWFSWSFRFIYSKLVPRIAKSVSMIITDSNNSRNDILEYLRVEVNKVRFSYLSVEPLFHNFSQPYDDRDDQLLFVGSLEPRKNLNGLIAAFNMLRDQLPNRKVKLYVVGCENPLFANTDYKLGKYAADINFVGYIDDMTLAKLYGRSKALVYPSFYEGFGFPPLEAMAAGAPVITSWNSSLPEVVGDAALLVNPADPHSIANKMMEIITNPTLAKKLIEKGKAKVSEYSWEKVGYHTLSVYRDLVPDLL